MNLYALKLFVKKQFFRLKYILRYKAADDMWQLFAKKIQKPRQNFYTELRKSYGKKNPESIYYVIRRRPPAWGFFSNLIFVIQGLVYAEKNGYVPVVDMENYWVGELSSSKRINGTHNAWCYFFEQTSNINLSEVYKSKNVILSSGTSIMGNDYWMNDRKFAYVHDVSKLKIMSDIINQYIKLNLVSSGFIQESKTKLNWSNEDTFGVFIRGTGYSSYAGAQPQLPEIEYYISSLEQLLNKGRIKKLYIATEDFRIYSKFIQHFGSSFIVPSLRYKKDLKIEDWEKSQKLTFDHAILMGYEKTLIYLTETFLLSLCKNYICNLSNASVISLAISDLGNVNRWIIEPNQVRKLDKY